MSNLKTNPFLDTTINYQTQVKDKLNLRHDEILVEEEERLITKTLYEIDPYIKSTLDDRITLRTTISYH